MGMSFFFYLRYSAVTLCGRHVLVLDLFSFMLCHSSLPGQVPILFLYSQILHTHITTYLVFAI